MRLPTEIIVEVETGYFDGSEPERRHEVISVSDLFSDFRAKAFLRFGATPVLNLRPQTEDDESALAEIESLFVDLCRRALISSPNHLETQISDPAASDVG